ncbi:MAG: hypothetical protein M1832_006121 [Thelocarpon impressellum]|nr:MAG: hypothetical protein M1832_006121 [Thelocarpon impressellum]
MSSKDNNSSRNRDNQRRSRARRSEYIKELESRWQKCQLTGAEASAEIQAAARKVLDENKALRALLRRRGVSDSEVDECVSGPVEEPVELPPADELEYMLDAVKSCDGMRPSCGGESALRGLRTPVMAQTEQPQQGRERYAPGPLLEATPQTPGIAPPPAVQRREDPAIATAQQDAHPVEGDMEHIQGGTTPPLAPRTTGSCLTAVQIMGSMGLGIGADEVRAELGCGQASHCDVDTGALFEIMDRHTDGPLG